MHSSYHHGDLANSLIAAAVHLLKVRGIGQLSLREVAREAGVSHGAPAHHFGDKRGLLTAIAIQGYTLLAEALAQSHSGSSATGAAWLIEIGEAYIRFAVARPAHFEMMFNPSLINYQDPEYLAAECVPRKLFVAKVREFLAAQWPDRDPAADLVESTAIGFWSQVHGFACLWLAGSLGDTGNKAVLDNTLGAMLHSLVVPVVDAYQKYDEEAGVVP